MSDSYQAIYDAVRSRINGCDVQEAVESAVRAAFSMAEHHIACVAQTFASAADDLQSPGVLYRPKLYIDGNQWCALYGDNMQDGVVGFGDSPALAMADFNRSWIERLARAQAKEGASNVL